MKEDDAVFLLLIGLILAGISFIVSVYAFGMI